jgi:hypothetical protein
VPEQARAWTWAGDESGKVEYGVRNVGYWETNGHPVMPAAGTCHPVPLRPAGALPDGTEVEAWLRDDVIELWSFYRKLNSDRRRQFLQVATKLHEAFSLWRDSATLSFALLVVSCEALKPTGPAFRDHNIYDVVEALLGKSQADRLRQQVVPPQSVRDAHLHAGEFHGSEIVEAALFTSYQDPSFDEAQRALTQVTRAAIVEWLRCGGEFTMPIRVRKRSLRRLLRDYVHILLPVGLAAGAIVGWLLRSFV